MPYLAGITIYPFKALDGVAVPEIRVLESGALSDDRRFAILDGQGNFVNGKRYDAVHRLRARFDLQEHLIRLTKTNASAGSKAESVDETGEGSRMEATFHLDEERSALEQWLSGYFGFRCRVVTDAQFGFPDDRDANGPTLLSAATLREVNAWFPGLVLDDVRRRFRANLELDGVEPFWEDRLCGEPGRPVPFQIGSVRFLGTNPCQRCVVPSRSADTGEAIAEFAKLFSSRREALLPAWAPRARFNHFYRLAVNTRLAALGKGVLRLGDEVMM